MWGKNNREAGIASLRSKPFIKDSRNKKCKERGHYEIKNSLRPSKHAGAKQPKKKKRRK